MNILFVCTGNTCRSPMAEALAKTLFPKEEYNIKSVGVSVGEGGKASENAILAAEKFGIDLKNHKTTQISADVISWADIVLTMTNGHKQAIAGLCAPLGTPVFTIAEYSGHGNDDVVDPYGCGVEIYENCILNLKEYIEEIVDIITK